MKNARRAVLCAAALAALALVPTTASAQPVAAAPGAATPGAEGGAAADMLDLQINVGLKGGLMTSFATEAPDDAQVDYEGRQYVLPDTEIYGGFGLGPALGLTLEARAEQMYSFETGFYWSNHQAEGFSDKKVNGIKVGRIYSNQETVAYHLPLLLKINMPTGTIKPFLGLGIEFIFQSDTDYVYTGENTDRGSVDGQVDFLNDVYSAETTNYLTGLLTFGVEIDLGQFRIPVELRANYNFAYDEEYTARVNDIVIQNNRLEQGVYDGEFLGHAAFYTGFVYEYDLML